MSIVNYNGHVLFDEFFKPRGKVTNYLTWVSGITYENTKNASYYSDLKSKVMRIFKDKIIVGHSIHNDFKVLFYYPDESKVRDISKISILKRNGKL